MADTTTLADVRVSSEGRLEDLEASTASCRAFLECLSGRAPQPPDASLDDGFEADTAAAVGVLQRLAEREPHPALDEALAAWSAAHESLSRAAAQRLEALQLPRPDSFTQLVRDACASLHFEFDRPVSDVTSMVLGVFPHVTAAGLVAWEMGRAVEGHWSSFPAAEVTVLVMATAWYHWAKWRRRRAAAKRVRVTIFGVHADGLFFAFGDIVRAWVGRGGAVVVETRRGERVHLQTSHAVELQQVLSRHGVTLTTRALIRP